MKQLIETINRHKEHLANIEIDKTDINYLNKFFPNLEFLSSCDFFDLTKLFYMVNKKASYNEAEKSVELISPIVEALRKRDENAISLIMDSFNSLKDEYNFVPQNFKEFTSFNTFNKEIISLRLFLSALKHKCGSIAMDAFILWMTDKDLKNALEVATHLKILNENLNKPKYRDFRRDIPLLSVREVKKANKKLTKEINSLYIKEMQSVFSEELLMLSSYQLNKNSEIKGKIKNLRKQMKSLEALEKDLKNGTLTLSNLETYELDPNILNAVLIEFIKEKNNQHSKIYIELANLTNKKIDALEENFKKHNLDFNQLTEEEKNTLTTINKEQLNQTLELITKGALKFINVTDEAFMSILLLPTSTLKQLEVLVIRSLITPEFILRHGNKFTKNNIESLIKVIEKLSLLNIDFNSLQIYNDEILLNANTKLLDILFNYGINLENKQVNYFEFLEDPKLLNIIDQFIELGLEDQMANNLDLISNQSNNAVKRIVIMRAIDIEFLDDKSLNQTCVKGTNFYISDDDLEEYANPNYQIHMDSNILSILTSHNNLEMLEAIPEEISFIENYKLSNQIYQIGDNYFSRIKVLRCLKTLIDNGYTDYETILFNSLIYNYPTYLSIDLIEELKNLDKNSPKKQLI